MTDMEPALTVEEERLHRGAATLHAKLQEFLGQHPEADYLASHAQRSWLLNHTRLVRWYARYLPPQGRILDWGCCHAPDSILLRAVFGDAFEFHGCDFVGSVDFGPLRDLAAVQFQPLRDTVRLPYADRFFDVVIGSGTLEHVAMDYESLKELHRILKPGGLFIFTYLPYQRSKVERVNREVHRTFYHNRLYRTAEINQLLRRTGFLPETIEYQERLLRREIQTRVLARHPRRFRRLVSWFKLRFGDRIRGRTSNSSLCGVARKMEMM